MVDTDIAEKTEQKIQALSAALETGTKSATRKVKKDVLPHLGIGRTYGRRD